MARIGQDLLQLGVGGALAVGVMVLIRTTGLPPEEGPGLVLTFVLGSAAFTAAVLVVLVRALGLRGPALLRTVAMLLAGATFWDAVALTAAPSWYGEEGSPLATSAAMILFGVGVLLWAGCVVADRTDGTASSARAGSGGREPQRTA